MQESGLTFRSQMLKGFVDLAVMTVLEQGESYGYEIMAWLEKAGLGDVSHASLYASLKRLEDGELVTVSTRPSALGPTRRYYQLTEPGRARREELAGSWRQLATALAALEEARDAG